MWFWGWSERKEGAIPLDVDQAAQAIPLRRFFCTGCGRTFGWRPPFLLYGRRLAAVTYQQSFMEWAGLRRRPRKSPRGWWEQSRLGRKGFFRVLRGRCKELLLRFGVEQPATLYLRKSLWYAVRHLATRNQIAVQVLCQALASHPSGAKYRL